MPQMLGRHQPFRAWLITLCGIALGAGGTPLIAQTGAIAGRITEGPGQRQVVSAQVHLPGTGIGTLTRANGTFQLENVPAGTHRLEVRSIGYRTAVQEVQVVAGQTTTVDFQIIAAAIALEEIVATGVGVVTERKRLGASMQAVSSEALAATPVANVTDALVGRVPGLVSNVQGETGSATPMRLRGNVSISQRNSPVVYIDGVRVDASSSSVASATPSRLSDLNPADIERIEVLKGAAAATLFGTEASSGVIQIFTKRGSQGPPRYSFRIDQQAISIPESRFPGNYVYDPISNQILSNHPERDFLRTGYQQGYSLSVSGGGTNVNYILSGRFLDETAAVPSNAMQTASVRAGIDVTHSDKLSSSFNVDFGKTRVRAPYPGWGLAGEFVLSNPLRVNVRQPYGELFYTIRSSLAYQNFQDAYHGTVSARTVYKWNDQIRSEVRLGYNLVDENTTVFLRRGDGVLRDVTGIRNRNDERRTAKTIDANTAWDGMLGEAVTAQVVVGAQAFFENKEVQFAGARDFSAPGLETLRGAATITGLDEYREEVINAGFFGQTQFGLWDRLFLTTGLRVDGNSAFGEAFGLQVYPKAGLSYVLSDQDFWTFDDWGWNTLRLRAAYGTAGLQPGAFDAQRTFRSVALLANLPAILPKNLGNADLRPERSIERELGAEMEFGEGRIGVDLTYFWQNTMDAILPKPNPPSGGFVQPQLTNIGELQSSGFEGSIQLRAIQTPSFGWNLAFTFATLDQKVTDLGGVAPFLLQGAGLGFRHQSRIQEGYQPGAFISPVLDEANPYTLTVPVENFTSLSQLSVNRLKNSAGADSLVFLGNPMPSLQARLASTFQLPKGLTLSAVLRAETGFIMFNETGMIRQSSGLTRQSAELANELADPNTSAARRGEIAEEWARHHWSLPGNWVEDGDYLRLEEVALQYRLPATLTSHIGMDDLTLMLAGRNLKTFTNFAGVTADPGAPRKGGITDGFVLPQDYFTMPIPRRFTLTMRGSW